MEQNKVRTYLLYAFGEILLVMIGILLALQVNNWNEERNKEARASQLATSLISEFNDNLNQLDNLFDIHNTTQNASMYLLGVRERNENISFDESKLNNRWSKNYLNAEYVEKAVIDTLWRTGFMWTYDPVNGALRSGISSGDINLFKNDSLKAKLFAWEDLVKDLDEEETRLINQEIEITPFKDRFIPMMYMIHIISNGQVPPSNFQPEIIELLHHPDFENYLMGKLSEILNIKAEMRVLEDEAKQIINLLQEELD